MEVILIWVIFAGAGAITAYATSLWIQAGLFILVVSYLGSSAVKNKELGGIFDYIMCILFIIGLGIGNIVYYINPTMLDNFEWSDLDPRARYEEKVDETKTKNSNLPTLICSHGGKKFLIENYKTIEEGIVSEGTKIIYNKKDCVLK